MNESSFNGRSYKHIERECENMDACASNNLFREIIAKLPTEPEDVLDTRQIVRLWTNGDEILGKNEDRIEGIANLLEAIGFDVNTGYYDPLEDERNHEVDRNTGYYYVTIC